MLQGIRMKNPAHPGGFVKSEIIEALGLSVTDAARALGVTRAALSALVNERARLSSEMALRIETPLGQPSQLLNRRPLRPIDSAWLDSQRVARGLCRSA